MKFKNTSEFAKSLDKIDKLSDYRNQFHIPEDKDGKEIIYLCGNSLGLQPKSTKEYINQEMEDWAKLGVSGWSNAKNPWLSYHSYLTKSMAKVVGARPIEVVVMNTLTVNLHLMMVSFYKPTKSKFKIIIESDAFPSDIYAVESQLEYHGFNASNGLIFWETKTSNDKYKELEKIFKDNPNEICLILIGGVNYYTGEFFDLKKITNIGHNNGSIVGFDCAHGAGNVELNLHESGADFAIWCTYKYLNSGPGNLSGCFVHERHANQPNLNRFKGWWSNKLTSRFNMREKFNLMPGAEGWQLSTPTITSMAAIKASLEIFDNVGIKNLRKKSILLTSYLEFLINELGSNDIEIITPKNINSRGCQISIKINTIDKKFHNELTRSGIITDWRDPNVIRFSPTPLYNTFIDIYRTGNKLKQLL